MKTPVEEILSKIPAWNFFQVGRLYTHKETINYHFLVLSKKRVYDVFFIKVLVHNAGSFVFWTVDFEMGSLCSNFPERYWREFTRE